jgi:cytochrome c biogenesis protein CcmG/thiol:disulfide interchange protein DsbE
VLVVLVIGLTQLGGTSGEGGGGPVPTTPRTAKASKAPQLLDGKGFRARLAALKGKPVVVNIWGSWCIPCRQEFPIFQRVSEELDKRVVFLGLDTQDPIEDARKFLAEHPLIYPSYTDTDGSLAKSFGIIGTPSTVYYDRSGKASYLHQGPYRKDADLRADIKRYTGA